MTEVKVTDLPVISLAPPAIGAITGKMVFEIDFSEAELTADTFLLKLQDAGGALDGYAVIGVTAEVTTAGVGEFTLTGYYATAINLASTTGIVGGMDVGTEVILTHGADCTSGVVRITVLVADVA